MSLLQHLVEKAPEISELGLRAVQQAKQHGIPAYYMDDATDRILCEYPDGRVEIIKRSPSQE